MTQLEFFAISIGRFVSPDQGTINGTCADVKVCCRLLIEILCNLLLFVMGFWLHDLKFFQIVDCLHNNPDTVMYAGV
jgi:hypothetical protein